MTKAKSPKTLRLTRGSGADRVLIATKLAVADNVVSRNVGLLKHESLPKGNGLWIKRCNSIHTFFMRFPIDVIFIDKRYKVVSVYRDLKPWRVTRLHFKASSVIELPAGTLNSAVEESLGIKGAALRAGDVLSFEDVDPGGANG